MDAETVFVAIADRPTAERVFSQLRVDGASHYERGLFFRAILDKGLWASKDEIATSFGLSRPQVSKLVKMAELPPDVVYSIGNPSLISFRVAQILLDAIQRLGVATVVRRTKQAQRLGYSRIDDRLGFIRTGRATPDENARVVVRLARDRKALRVEMPHLSRYEGRLPQLEMVIANAISAFERAVEREVARDLMNEEIFSRERKARDELSARSGTGAFGKGKA